MKVSSITHAETWTRYTQCERIRYKHFKASTWRALEQREARWIHVQDIDATWAEQQSADEGHSAEVHGALNTCPGYLCGLTCFTKTYLLLPKHRIFIRCEIGLSSVAKVILHLSFIYSWDVFNENSDIYGDGWVCTYTNVYSKVVEEIEMQERPDAREVPDGYFATWLLPPHILNHWSSYFGKDELYEMSKMFQQTRVIENRCRNWTCTTSLQHFRLTADLLVIFWIILQYIEKTLERVYLLGVWWRLEFKGCHYESFLYYDLYRQKKLNQTYGKVWWQWLYSIFQSGCAMFQTQFVDEIGVEETA